MLQQRGLADSCFAAEDQHPALTRPHAGDQLIQCIALTLTAQQSGWWEVGVGHA
jgi:hypothetical protein